MQKFSGLLLDHYDDPDRATLRSIYPDPANIPVFVKQARDLSASLDRYPDHLFALCMKNEEEVLRKYATVDPGNTWVSSLYFLKQGHLLPDVAQVKTASRLLAAAQQYDLPLLDDLHKIAFMGALLKGIGSRVAGSVAKDPLGAAGKAVGGAMTLGSVVGAGSQAASNLSQAAKAKGSVLPLSSFGG